MISNMQQNPKAIFTKSLTAIITNTFNSLSGSDIIHSISHCDPKFGQYSTNIAFILSKLEGKSPSEVAESIVAGLARDKNIKKAEFLQPGFINVSLSDKIWLNYADSIDAKFATAKTHKAQSIQLEFISANPSGPLVLTNAWQGYYGDILSNIYASQGYRVSREYYLNDGGNQVIALGRAVQQALGVKFDKEIATNLYRGEYIDNIAEVITTKMGAVDKVKESEPADIGARAAAMILESYIKPGLVRLGVNFDSIYSESKPDIKKTLNRLKEAGLVRKKDGAIWLKGADVGLKQDEVLVRSYDNGYSYFLKDVAYQLERLEERGFDKTITIVGPDHHGQAIRLVNTLRALGLSSFIEISTQTIRLIKDGKEFKMSKRKGNYILLDDFLDEIPTEVARFYFAMRDTNTHMDFDIDLVKEHSAKNPVYYSLYAYARACAIVKKAQEQGISSSKSFEGYNLTKAEQHLLLELSKIEEVLQEIIDSHKVHQLLHQTVAVAKAFHEYYELEKVLGDANASQKLRLIEHFMLAYQSLFAILGVDLLQRM